jgi:hypothetical protein
MGETAGEFLTGRRDWDVVGMDDYRSDMRESSEQAAAAIEYVKGRERVALNRVAFLELALADALKQLGPGSVAKVYEGSVQRLPDGNGPTLIVERYEYDRTVGVRLGKEDSHSSTNKSS